MNAYFIKVNSIATILLTSLLLNSLYANNPNQPTISQTQPYASASLPTDICGSWYSKGNDSNWSLSIGDNHVVLPTGIFKIKSITEDDNRFNLTGESSDLTEIQFQCWAPNKGQLILKLPDSESWHYFTSEASNHLSTKDRPLFKKNLGSQRVIRVDIEGDAIPELTIKPIFSGSTKKYKARHIQDGSYEFITELPFLSEAEIKVGDKTIPLLLQENGSLYIKLDTSSDQISMVGKSAYVSQVLPRKAKLLSRDKKTTLRNMPDEPNKLRDFHTAEINEIIGSQYNELPGKAQLEQYLSAKLAFEIFDSLYKPTNTSGILASTDELVSKLQASVQTDDLLYLYGFRNFIANKPALSDAKSTYFQFFQRVRNAHLKKKLKGHFEEYEDMTLNPTPQ